MSHDDDPPKDAKTELEDQLVRQAEAPWSQVLDADQREGMRIALTLFVKTHPAMQRAVARRVEEDAAATNALASARAGTKGVPATREAAQATKGVPAGVVSPAVPATMEDLAGTTERIVDASGVVAKPGVAVDQPKDAARSKR